MDKNMKNNWIKNHLPSKRRLIQLYAALLYNANLKGYIEGEIYVGNTKSVCVPGLNCYSCPGAVGACPLGALQNALASSGNRAPFYIVGILLLFGLILGRTICGFLCPFGLIQELLHKIPTPKLPKGRITRVLSYLKYVILVVFVTIVPLWYSIQHYPLPAFCKYICPAGTLEGAIGLLANPVNEAKLSMLNILFTRKFVILVIIVAACIFIYRGFCRFLCPLGALYGLFARFNLIGVKVEAPKCTHCGKCVAHCGMDIRHVGDHECINCGGCIDVCPTGAISFKAGNITLRANEAAEAPHKEKLRKRRRIAWIIALAALIAALLYFNFPKPSSDAPAAPETETMQETVAADNESSQEASETDSDSVQQLTEADDAKETSVTSNSDPQETANADKEKSQNTTCSDSKNPQNAVNSGDKASQNVTGSDGRASQNVADSDGKASQNAAGSGNDQQAPSAGSDSGTQKPAQGTASSDKDTAQNDSSDKNDTSDLPSSGKKPDNTASAQAAPSQDLPTGNEPGMLAPDFQAPIYGGGTFNLADTKGKVTVINFWATWCTPCVAELPHFQKIHENYPDVEIVAIHSSLVTDDVDAYLADKEYTIPFALDDSDIITAYGGSTMLPQTIVLDANGVVTYNKVGSVTYELLESLISEASGN